MLMKVATDHGNYANRKRKCGKVQKNVLNSSNVPNTAKIYVKSYKKGLHGPDALHELEMLVANLMCVHAKTARDR